MFDINNVYSLIAWELLNNASTFAGRNNPYDHDKKTIYHYCKSLFFNSDQATMKKRS